MWSGRSVLSARVLWVLGLVLTLMVIAIALPLAAMAASDDAEPVPEETVITVNDPLHRPAVILEGEEARAQFLASLPGEEAGSGTDVGLATLSPYVFDDWMESGSGSWVANPNWAITEEWTLPWMSPGNHSWSDSPSSNYGNNVNSSLVSGTFDLSAVGPTQTVALTFIFESELEYQQDFVQVEYSDDNGGSWYYYGDYITGDYTESTFYEYIPSAMLTSQFKFRFRIITNGTITYDGIHIDNIHLQAFSTDLIEEDDARAAYLGTWSPGALVDDYGYTWYYNYSNAPGDVVRVAFDGPAVMVLGRKGADGGIASISMDDEAPYEMDFYAPPDPEDYYDKYPAWVTAHYNMTDGPHTLTMCVTGDKNPASWGNVVGFEEAIIWGTGTTATGPAHEEEINTNYEYVGPWAGVVDPVASGGWLNALNARGSLNVAFKGSYIAWNAKMGPGYGKAKVSVDGGPLQTVDLYNPWDSSKRRVFNTGLLTAGTHTLSIYWSGEKNALAWDTTIDVDSFDVFDTLVDADPAPPIPWRYQQTEPFITYLGDWTTTGSWWASGLSFASASQTGAAAIAQFNGTAATVIARTTAWYGKADIYVDEVFQETVDLYSPTTGWKAPVYSVDGLAPGPHTITIKCKGEANPSSSGTAIGLDAFDITGDLEQGPTPTRYHDSNTNLEYYPAWDTVTGDWHYSNLDFSSVDEAGWVNVEFEGTYLAWYGSTTPWYGKGYVILDGQYWNPTYVDLYSSSVRYKQRLYNTGLLDYGVHTVTVYWIGQKNWSSWGTRIGVDSFDVLGTLNDAGEVPPVTWRYQQDHPTITYLGDWTTTGSWWASGLSFASTAQAGAAAIVKFTGEGLVIYSRVAPWYGEVEIRVDNGPTDVVDLYREYVQWKVPIVMIEGLSPGEHLLYIRCRGTSNPSSWGTTVAFDAIDLAGYLKPAPAVTRIQQDDSYWMGLGHLTYSGAWYPSGDTGWQASGNSFAGTDEDDATVTLEFYGVYVSLLSRTTPWYGKALVSLYEGSVAPSNLIQSEVVDLYTGSVGWKQTVYSSGLLPEGTYNLVVECLHEKYAWSWGYSIAVDAFDTVLMVP